MSLLVLEPLRNRSFQGWTAANFISSIGTWMQVLAGNWLLFAATGSAAQLGIGVLLTAVPVILLSPWAGALADRTPAKPLLTTTHLLHAALAIGLAAVAWSGTDPVWWVYGAMLAGGVVSAVEGPALGRFGSTMVEPDRLGAGLAIGSLTGAVGRVIGLAVGGGLVAVAGPAPLFLLNAASFPVAIAMLRRLRPVADPDPGEPAAVPVTAWAGLRCMLRDPVVLVTLALAFLLGSVGRNYQVTMAAMSAGPLGAGADAYGLLSTVFAVGAVVGGLLAGAANRMYGQQLVVLGLVMSVLQGLSGLAPDLWAFAATMLPIAAATAMFDTVVATRLQLDLPFAVRGRVLATVGATGAVAGAVGAPVLGQLCDAVGPRAALGLAGAVTTAGCLAAGTGFAALRRRPGAAGRPAVASPAGHPAPARRARRRRYPRGIVASFRHAAPIRPRRRTAPAGDRIASRAGSPYRWRRARARARG